MVFWEYFDNFQKSLISVIISSFPIFVIEEKKKCLDTPVGSFINLVQSCSFSKSKYGKTGGLSNCKNCKSKQV